ncbi:MAG: DUF58 domain-containing protein [Scytolyngbya sp. HA4215-MV1]|jgi:uncharacterized protein (DUF58 family)|nr:DUF58 domain-containing protein [Scytolyngbya sp. HA4215-MV1]
MLPSKRTYALLILGGVIAILLASVWQEDTRLQVAISFLLLFDGILFGLLIGDGWRGKAQRVEVTRKPLQRLSIGRENPVVLTIKSRQQPTEILIRDHYPAEFVASASTLQATIPANSTQEVSYTVNPANRGAFTWGDLHIRQLTPWQLGWYDWKIDQKQSVAVYPDLIGLRSLSIRLTLQSTGAMKQARRIGMGTEFAELRDYSMGDDPRLIDWKATARRNRPLLRVLEPEQEQTLIILLDQGRLMTARVKGLTRFDWGLNATLSLALAGLNRGDRVGVGVFDRQINTWIPPERGQHQLFKLLERLTPLQPAILEPDYLGAVTTLVNQQTRRALVVLITDLVDVTASTELLAALGRLTPRYLPFCVTLRDPQIDRQAHNQTEAIAATYARAVALDLLAQRQVAFADLKRKGVLVLDAPANQITEQLVDRYLQLKSRSQL